MSPRPTTFALLVSSIAFIAGASAQDADVTDGEKLYVAQCKICHGDAAVQHTGESIPASPHAMRLRLAMQQVPVTDVPQPVASRGPSHRSGADNVLAFAPPFGPNLQGVYGRPAGTAKGYEYSGTFLKALSGMEWNDASLNVWIANPQAWVPGVYMYYKQTDPEVRRKIIAYLKANR